MLVFVQLATIVTLVASHGVFWTPDNRATISQRAGDQPDASMIIAEPVSEELSQENNYDYLSYNTLLN